MYFKKYIFSMDMDNREIIPSTHLTNGYGSMIAIAKWDWRLYGFVH